MPVGCRVLCRSLHLCRSPLCARAIKAGAVKVASKTGAVKLATDPESLAKLCVGAEVYKEKSDPEILADDSQYPEWLWSLRKEGPPSLEELDPKDMAYWEALIELTYKQAQIDRPKPKHRKFKEF